MTNRPFRARAIRAGARPEQDRRRTPLECKPWDRWSREDSSVPGADRPLHFAARLRRDNACKSRRGLGPATAHRRSGISIARHSFSAGRRRGAPLSLSFVSTRPASIKGNGPQCYGKSLSTHHLHQVANLLFNLGGAVHGLGYFLAQGLAVALAQTVHRDAEVYLSHPQPGCQFRVRYRI